jgi:uncharacterized protein YgbK (DUF1537 family)
MNEESAHGWAIIADDLTGAADAAATYGPTHTSSVVLELDGVWPDAEILAINTESRYLPEHQAMAAVSAAVARALRLRRRVFKKIDSLLRGNVGVEIAAAMAGIADGRSRGLVIVAPAFPGTGRTTVNGIVHVNGVPNTAGSFAGDVCQALAAGGLITGSVALEPGRNPEKLAALLNEMHRSGVNAVVLDAESDEDLRTAVSAAELLDVPTLLAGSGGLASHIAARKESKDRNGAKAALEPTSAQTLLVIGSYSNPARAQVQELVAAGVQHVKLDHATLSAPAVEREVLKALMHNDVVLTPDPEGALDKSQAHLVANALALATAAAISNCGALVLTGGETATAVLEALGVASFTVLGEIESGVVVSRLAAPLPLMVTKAGAFGDAGALVRTTKFLTSSTTETSIK